MEKVQIFYLTLVCKKKRKLSLSFGTKYHQRKEKTQMLFLVNGCQRYFCVNRQLQNFIVNKYEYDLASTCTTFAY